ncbi:phage major capsid protein [Granulicella sp. L46]|uniref:phage major capsid protein n=1 Tax=Granulicella sp. L46 TaxID=1641865 RepID=UPI00131D24BC|nr:phage major capsid protein [Granulicella sp. L46]
MTLMEMLDQHKEEIAKADALIGPMGHQMTASDEEQYKGTMRRVEALRGQIEARKAQSTIRSMFNKDGIPMWIGGDGTPGAGGAASGFMATYSPALNAADTQSRDYSEALRSFLLSGGKTASADLVVGADGQGGFAIPRSEAFTRQRPTSNYAGPRASAALYEGTQGSSTTAGGDVVSIPTWQQIVPLGLPDLALYDASLLIPTATDIKVPSQASFGASAIKAESNGTIATFGGSDPTLGQTLLSAYMVGAARTVSWELLQDVGMFQEFVVNDLLIGQRITEGALLATGTGSGQPQGILGNTGLGTNTAYEMLGTSADGLTLINALYDVVAQLKGVYQPNASWVMARATALAIRKAQMQANLYVPIITTDANGDMRILDKPVLFDSNMPSLPTATTAGVLPILYGDFRAGNMIGVRGGAGINVKILDQPLALQGQLAILAYRRIDSRIRRSEAIQQIKISHV